MAIMNFGDVLDALFDDKDFNSIYTKSNKNANSVVEGCSLQEITKMITDCSSPEALINVVNPMNAHIWDRKYYSWNFTNVSRDPNQRSRPPLNTLEYRSPRATTQLKIIHQWIIFTVTFLHASLVRKGILNVKPTKDDLDKWLSEICPHDAPAALCWGLQYHFGK